MADSSRLGRVSARVVHPLAWVWEPLQEHPTFLLRSMFGAKSVYLDGRIMLCCVTGAEPWNGVLVCTSREYHDSLRAQFPALVEHPVLGKWLYLSQENPRLESLVSGLVRLIRSRDPRIGVVPAPRKSRKRTARPS